MKNEILRLVLSAFSIWVRKEMQPAGRAAYLNFEARATTIIDELPEDGVPDLGPTQGLGEAAVVAGMDWLLTAVRMAYPEDWARIAVETLRIVLHRNIKEITGLSHPPLPGVLGQPPPRVSAYSDLPATPLLSPPKSEEKPPTGLPSTTPQPRSKSNG